MKIDLKINISQFLMNYDLIKKEFDSLCYPNLFKIFVFVYTISLMNVKCERVFSKLNLIKT